MNYKTFVKKILLFYCGCILSVAAYAQQQASLIFSLDDLIELGKRQSLDAFQAKNMYLTSYGEFYNYTVRNLPTLSLSSNPITFNNSIDVSYSIIDSVNVIQKRRNFNSDFNLRINQNISKTGGRIFIDSDLARLASTLPLENLQYSATPIRLGFSQPLFAFNDFKWQKILEPLKFEIAKKTYLESAEDASIAITGLFFDLLLAQKRLDMAQKRVADADTLYQMGLKRFDIGSIEKNELNLLHLGLLDIKIQLIRAQNDRDRARSSLISYFMFDEKTRFKLQIPVPNRSLILSEDETIDLAMKNSPQFMELHQQKLEAERQVERLKYESFDSNLDVSYGINNAAAELSETYNDMDQQQRISVSLNIPIIDWGQRKRNYKLSQSAMRLINARIEQSHVNFKVDVAMMTREFNLQHKLIESAEVSLEITQETYEVTKKRFLLGNGDVLTMSTQLLRQENALITYIEAQRQYWTLYFTLRRATLYDFEKRIPLSTDFDSLINSL